MSSTRLPGTAGFEDTLRSFWATRPLRPRTGGKLGGVSAAIGTRYGIDPILVRVAFVLATIYGGAGVVLYLLGWLVFPKEGDPLPGSTEPTRKPTSTGLAVVLVLLLIPGVFLLTNSPAIIGVALGLGALYLLQRNYGDRGVTPTATAPAAAAPVAGPQPAVPVAENTWVYPGVASTTTNATQAEQPPQQPPAWDPLEAAPFAWDLPEPSEPEGPQPQRRKRRWITIATLALAAFASVLAAAIGAPPESALAIALAVLGLGMIGGAFLRGGRGLIGAAIPVGALAMAMAVLPMGDFTGNMGSDEVRPTSIENVLPHYQRSVGSVLFDLRDLRITDGQELRTGANVGLGDITVRLPPNVNVTARCASELGDVRCFNDTADGQGADISVTDQGEDGPGGGHIVLDLVVGTGSVEVTRG